MLACELLVAQLKRVFWLLPSRSTFTGACSAAVLSVLLIDVFDGTFKAQIRRLDGG